MPLDFNPLAPPDWRDPYSVYRRLRDEAPVCPSEAGGVVCISRYDDVVEVLRDPETFSSRGAFDVLVRDRSIGPGDVFEMLRYVVRARVNPIGIPDNLISLDPPRHDELRGRVNRGFTPRRIQSWEKRAREIVADCTAPLDRGESFELVSDLAIPLPVTLIAEMLGVAPEDRARFKGWSDDLITGVSGSQRNEPLRGFLKSMGELNAYMRPVVRSRQVEPGDDLISLLVDPRHDEALSDSMVRNFVVLLLVAGNETTTNLIGNAVLALLRNPEQLALVQADPERISDVIEETLRYDSPIQILFRRPTRDVELSGAHIPAGCTLAVMLGSANRDERRFEDPDRFDITRNVRGHVAFGLGVHFCLGASLARLEAKAALEALVPRLAKLRPREAETHFVDSVLVRGPKRLELVAV